RGASWDLRGDSWMLLLSNPTSKLAVVVVAPSASTSTLVVVALSATGVGEIDGSVIGGIGVCDVDGIDAVGVGWELAGIADPSP
ncbi:hypothetical protein Tco_1000224, partial [Tanacetum coccineum]